MYSKNDLSNISMAIYHSSKSELDIENSRSTYIQGKVCATILNFLKQLDLKHCM